MMVFDVVPMETFDQKAKTRKMEKHSQLTETGCPLALCVVLCGILKK